MTYLRTILLLTLLIATALPARAASARPRAGIGILLLRPLVPDGTDEMKAIPLYADPGIGRLAEVDASRLPSLQPALAPISGEHAVAVVQSRGEWLKVAYDGAGREGWIRLRRSWDYLPWREFLTGRTGSLLPGLRESLALLRREPSDDAASLLRLTPDQGFRIVSFQDDWVRVTADGNVDGWLRWRDGDGRLLFALEARVRQPGKTW